jgi:hypothetical protein
MPDFGGISDLAFRVDVLNDQAGSTQHGLFTIPGLHSQGLINFEIDKKANSADYQINRQRSVKRQYPKNRQRKERYKKYQMTHGWTSCFDRCRALV